MVDASVVARWILPGEPYQKNAVKLKEDSVLGIAELYAPSFIVEEVANALWRATKLHRISKGDAQEALKTMSDMRIELHQPNWSQISQGLSIACELDVTVYDTSYLLLANRLKAHLITADKNLYETAKEHFRITHVKDY